MEAPHAAVFKSELKGAGIEADGGVELVFRGIDGGVVGVEICVCGAYAPFVAYSPSPVDFKAFVLEFTYVHVLGAPVDHLGLYHVAAVDVVDGCAYVYFPAEEMLMP